MERIRREWLGARGGGGGQGREGEKRGVRDGMEGKREQDSK